MVVCVDFVYQLTVEVSQLFKSLLQQAPHALLFPLVLLFLPFLLVATSQVTIDWVKRVHLQNTEGLFSAHTTILASADLFDVRTTPRVIFLNTVHNVVFVNKSQTIETEFFLTWGCQIVPVALIDQFPFDFAHVTGSDLHKRNCWAFVEG